MLSIRKGLALALATAMLVAGCGGTTNKGETKPTTPAPVAETPKDPVKIDFWHGMADDSAHGKVLKQLVDEFNGSQKEVIVTSTYQGSYGDLEKKLTAAVAANKPPHVVQNTDSMLTNLVRANAVQPLDNLIDKKELNDYIPALLKAVTWDGKLMALPFNKSAIVLIYNKNLVKNPPKTWDEFKALSKEVTVAGKLYGTAFEPNVYDFGTHFAQAGGEWLKDGKANFNTEAGQQSLQFMVDMIKDGSAIFLKAGEYKSNYFNEGRVAMIGSTTASYAYIKPADKSEWGVAPLYSGPKGPAVPLSGANVSIISGIKADEAKAAATFITWLTNKEATLAWGLGKTGYGPVRQSALNDDRWKSFAKDNPEYGILGDALSSGVIQVNHPQWKAVQTEITNNVQAAFLSEKSVKQALDDAVKAADPLLQKK